MSLEVCECRSCGLQWTPHTMGYLSCLACAIAKAIVGAVKKAKPSVKTKAKRRAK